MLFNSVEFLFVFLPITFFVYFLLNKAKLINLATAWLVVASLAFYSYWKIDYLPLILISMVFNYSIGSTISHENKLKINKKTLFLVGIVGNIGLLVYYKYIDFLISNINTIFSAEFNYMNIVLPLAISFFTFQQIAYLVDSYEGKTKEYDFLRYALFVTFFPQLIAGPIVHHKEMMPQFENLRNRFINPKNISLGMFLLAIGLFKKVVIADFLSPYVAQIFDVISKPTFFEAWIGAFAYTFQLYFDFSGYTDMAMGIGYLFNIVLPQNFNSPLKANSIQDFWRRWHMTLSRFLRDYIYIPLGGNRLSENKTYRNLFLTFLIGGIWHGANWTFIIWGICHGLAMCIHRFWVKTQRFVIPNFCASSLTFFFVVLTFLIFRTHTVERAYELYKSLIGLNGFAPVMYDKFRLSFEGGSLKISLFLIIGVIIMTFFMKNSTEWAKNFKPTKLYFILTIVMLISALLNLNRISEFLYFQF